MSRAWDLSAEEQDIAIGFIERLHAAYLGAQKNLLEEGKDAVCTLHASTLYPL